MAGGDHCKESSDSDSVTVSESGSCSDSGSHSEYGTGSVVSLEESPIPTSKENVSENPKDQISMGKTSSQVSDPNEPLNENQVLVNQKTDISSRKHTTDKSQATRLKNRPLRTLRNFGQIELAIYRNDTDFFLDILVQAKITKNREYLAKALI